MAGGIGRLGRCGDQFADYPFSQIALHRFAEKFELRSFAGRRAAGRNGAPWGRCKGDTVSFLIYRDGVRPSAPQAGCPAP